tara:strand:+ start:87394 stop:88419 length:1026 start_codon:yes stop_codon:yes gene_type:complete
MKTENKTKVFSPTPWRKLKSVLFKKSRRNSLFTIAFYNLENLFDTFNHADKLDKDYTPNGLLKWTPERYTSKLNKLGSTIAKIGVKTADKLPVLIGVSEVENKTVLSDLLKVEALRNEDYGYLHYDSPDERGIDTALIYDKRYFEIIASKPIPLLVYNLDGQQDMTRDILYVHGTLNGEEIHVFVNHWPSRRDGGIETAYKRIKAADTIIGFMEIIEKKHEQPKYIVMGDFNDGPTAESIEKLLETQRFFHPMKKLLTSKRGSANYKFNWSLFDQIIISHNFLSYQKKAHSYTTANIFDPEFLKEFKGRYKGSPYRTYVGSRYMGGYSDHFPVYIQLKLNN